MDRTAIQRRRREDSRDRSATNPIRLSLETLQRRARERAGMLYLDGRPVRARDLVSAANELRAKNGRRRLMYLGAIG